MPAAAPPAAGDRRRERRGAHRTRLRAQPAARADPRSPVRVNNESTVIPVRGDRAARAFRKQPTHHHQTAPNGRETRANNTAPCQHFTSTNSHTRVFCLLTRRPHQSKKTSMKKRSRTRHVMVQSIGDTSGRMRQSEHPLMSSPLPQPRSHRRRLTSRRPCWLLSESLRPLAFRSPHMTDARGPHGDEIDSSSRLISTHAHDRNALDMSMAPDRPS